MLEFVKVYWFVNNMLRILLVLITIFLNQLFAEESNKLKLGVGLSSLWVPEYIGSSVQKQYILPYPYIYYASEKLTVEKNMLFGHLYNSKDFDIDLSFSGTLPVRSDSHSLRYGMQQLDPTIEIGPNFIYTLYNFEDNYSYLSVELPIRSVWSVDFPNMHHIGYITNPNMNLNYYFQTHLQLEVNTGPTFATKDYHNYFYKVSSFDITSKRPEYNGAGGYSGWKSSVGVSYEKGNVWYGAFVKYYNLSNAIFMDSPLVEQNNAIFYGVAISYIF